MNTKIYKQCIDFLDEGGFYETAKKRFKLPPKTIKNATNLVSQFDEKAYDEYCLTQSAIFYHQVTEFLNSNKG